MAGVLLDDRLNQLKSKINKICIDSGRAPHSAKVLAVSKLQSLERVREAVAAGQLDFAENYVQEACAKVASFPTARWHFIGRIQSNKVKLLIGKFYAIHSVDRLHIAQLLNRHCAEGEIRQNILLQLNVALEASKGGADEVELDQLFEFARNCSHLCVLGLMVMPPLSENGEDNRVHFRSARETLDRLRGRLSTEQRVLHPMNELSMGTTQDYAVAINEGATWVRIGTEIFGPRPTQEKS